MSQDNGPRGLSVGGPNGIHIDGNTIHIGQEPVASQSSAGLVLARPPHAAISVDLARAPTFLMAHPGAIAIALSVSASVLFVGAATVISIFQLPWLLLAAPGALAVALFFASTAIGLRARKRITTGGVDPDVERRIVDLAMTQGGRVTVTAASHALAMPMAQADATLSALAASGHVAVENDPASGVVVYVFPDIEAGLVPVRRSP